MKAKKLLIPIIIISVCLAAFICAYVLLKIYTSEDSIKSKITTALEAATGGELKIKNAHFDLFKGIQLNKIVFSGKKSENLRIEVEEILIRHEPMALLRGEILIDRITILSPELFIVREKDAIWRFLNGIKTFADHTEFAVQSDMLRNGVVAKNVHVHVFDEDIFRGGSLDIENMNLSAQPFGGSLRDIHIKAVVHDGLWNGFDISIDANLAVPELKVVSQLRNKYMTEELMKELPVIGEKFWETYLPTGTFDFTCFLTLNNKDNGQKVDYNFNLDIHDAEFTYKKWPFLIKHVNGSLEHSPKGLFLRSLKGSVQNEIHESLGEVDAYIGIGNARKRIDINIPNLKITEKLLKMIPDRGEEIRVKYDPKGEIDLRLTYESNEDKSMTGFSVKAMCRGVEANYPNFPYRLSHIFGQLEMNGENVYFRDVSGSFFDEERVNHFALEGEMNLESQKKRFTLSAPNLNLTEQIIKFIPNKGEEIWEKNKPEGQVDLMLNYTGFKDRSEDEYFITVDCKGNEIEYSTLPITVSDIIGRIVIDKEKIQCKSLRGYVVTGKQLSRATCNGVLGLGNENKKAFFSVLGLRVTDDLLDKFQKYFKSEWVHIEPQGWVDVVFDYESSDKEPKDNYTVVLNTEGCELSFSKFPFRVSEIRTRLNIENGYFVNKEFNGSFGGGRIVGAAEIDKNTSDGEYKGVFRFRDIDLIDLVEHLFKEPKELSGICDGNVEFHGRGSDINNFIAKGNAKISDAYITEVPFILNILNLLNLSIPTKDTFHSAQIKYSVKEQIVHIEEMKLISDTIELGGVGTVGLDGKLDLIVVAGFNKDTFSQIPLIGQLMDYVVDGVSKKLTKVAVTGTFSHPVSTIVTLEQFKHPIKSIFDLLSRERVKKTGKTEKGSYRNEDNKNEDIGDDVRSLGIF
ncbi:MAG: AsmA-like C-terminal region-containing protein [Candidatus Scalindua sp.]|nr:AsmA-like C-terminal region-containing protein [Candidatus Scalindua sp.]